MSRSSLSERRQLLYSALFMVIIVLLTGSMGIYVLADRDMQCAVRFARVIMEIDRLYQREVDWSRLFDIAMESMFAKLDRYSGYYKPGQFSRINEELSGKYTGIGVSVIRHEDGLLIMSVRENGPAAEVGLLSGDIIITADNTSLGALDVETAVGLLRGPEGSEIALEVWRPASGDTLHSTVTRRIIDLEHIPYAGFTPDSIVYIRLLDFDAGASFDLEMALDSLLHKQDVYPRGIILDLRGNPGGLFHEAYQSANLFLDEGRFIVGTKGRSRWSEEKHYSSGEDITGGLPLAVIVDGGSASSAEIMAGALKQLGRAVLVGDTTFGKGLVQGFTRFFDGSALRLTVSRYYLEGNVFLNEFDSTLNDVGHGLAPDYVVSFVEHEYFPQQLEHSLLMHRFANQNQEAIIEASDHFSLDDVWVRRFADFARAEGFEYQSPVTRSAEFVAEVARIEPSGPRFRAAVGRLLRKSRREDSHQFEHYAGYIKMRLKELALERKCGTYAAYNRAIVPQRPDILFTARLLRDGT